MADHTRTIVSYVFHPFFSLSPTKMLSLLRLPGRSNWIFWSPSCFEMGAEEMAIELQEAPAIVVTENHKEGLTSTRAAEMVRRRNNYTHCPSTNKKRCRLTVLTSTLTLPWCLLEGGVDFWWTEHNRPLRKYFRNVTCEHIISRISPRGELCPKCWNRSLAKFESL